MVEIIKDRYDFASTRIRELYFLFDETRYVKGANKEVTFKFDKTLGYNRESNLINFTLIVLLHYQNDTEEHPLAEIHIQNIFKVQDITVYAKKRQMNFPANLLTSIISVSVAHARALLAKNLSGTFLQEEVIPIINPVELAKIFYPNAFEEPVPETKSKVTRKKIPKSS